MYDFKTATPVSSVASADRLCFGRTSDGTPQNITFGNLVASAASVGSLLTGSGGPPTQVNPSTLSPAQTVVVIDPDAVAQGDNTAISTVTPSTGSGTTGNFTQATGGNQPSYRTGAGAAGLNGHAGIQFNGVHSLACASGGTSFNGDFYCAFVVRVDTAIGAGLGVGLWNFGSGGTGQTRSFGTNGGPGANQYTLTYNTGGGINTLNAAAPILTQGATAYVVEVIQRGKKVTGLINGVPFLAQSVVNVNSFVSNVITLGTTGFSLQATLFYWVLTAGVPSAANRAGVRQYLYSRFGLARTDDTPTPSFSGPGTLSEDDSLAHVAGLTCLTNPLVIGNYNPILTPATSVAPQTPAALSVYGNVAAQAGQALHYLVNGYPIQNVLGIQNLDPTGYAVLECFRHTGESMSAFGFALTQPWGDGGDGETFIEACNGKTTANYGGFRLLQTRLGVATSLRMRLLPSGVFEFYDQTAGPTPGPVIFGIQPNGAIVPANRTSDPASPAKGWLYFNSTSNKLKVYNGTTWETVTSA